MSNPAMVGEVEKMYRKLRGSYARMTGVECSLEIRARAELLNAIFDNEETIAIDGETVRLIRDDSILATRVDDKTSRSTIYIFDPEQLRRNQEETEIYAREMAGLI